MIRCLAADPPAAAGFPRLFGMDTATLARTGPRPGPVLAALAVLVLLAAFVAVVRQAVQQADASRRAHALHDEAQWRCRALRTASLRDDCLQRFHQERPGDSAALQALVRAAAASPLAALGPAR